MRCIVHHSRYVTQENRVTTGMLIKLIFLLAMLGLLVVFVGSLVFGGK
jgi:hypothetical protein